MTKYTEIPIGELFQPVGGNPKFIQRYIEANPGKCPVYSASLVRPFGYVNRFDFEGEYLSWTMNGYAGYVSEIRGRFSVTRDRGIFLPRPGVTIPDLTYLRLAMEPVLTASAVGRRIDGKRNTYTKLYPESAAQVVIRLPVDNSGQLDHNLMSELGARYRRVELAKSEIKSVLEAMQRSIVTIGVPRAPVQTISLGGEWMKFITTKTCWTKTKYSKLDTGSPTDIPVYSAAREAVAFVEPKYPGQIPASPEYPVISFGANGDGSAGTNFIFHERPFYVSNDRTCLQVLDPDIDPWYVYFSLHGMKERYGFSHAFKATIRNLGAVTINVPSTKRGFDPKRQREMVEEFRSASEAKRLVQTQLEHVTAAQLNFLD